MKAEKKRLDDVCDVEYGTRVVNKRDGGSVYPVYGGGGATFKMDQFNREDCLIVSRFAMSQECTRFVVGKFFLNDSGLTVSPKDATLLPRFLDYQILSLNDTVYALGKGSAQRNLDVPAFRDLTLFVPSSTTEQQRIVGILDEAFEGIATAKANAEKNLRNARALFNSHLDFVFTQHGDGWTEKALEQVADAKCSLSYGIVQPGDEYQNGLPVVRPTDLTTKVITLSGLKRIDPKLADSYRRTTLRGGELLLCVRGSTGVVSVASADLAGANVTRGIVPILFNEDLLTQDFGYYLVSSGAVQGQIRKKTYGAALMQINIGDLRKIMVSFPPLKEQETIAAKLSTLREETQRLESIYRQKLAALDALKKSLLHHAFEGKL